MRVAGKVTEIRECFWTSVQLADGQVIDARLGKRLALDGAELAVGDRVVVKLADGSAHHRNTVIFRTSDPHARLDVDPGPLPAAASREGLVRRGLIRPSSSK